MNTYVPAVIPQHPPLIIGNISINQDAQGRYCLNDLHRAAGGEEKHSPNRWTRSDGYKSLINELTPEMAAAPSVINKGGNTPGTYVCKELVYGYAMWISAAFNLKVIRAYDSMVSFPAVPSDPFLAQMEMVKTVYLNQLEIKKEQEQQRLQIAEHDSRFEAMIPRLTASAITTILGAISHTAKIYRQAQSIKHIKVSVPESTEYFRLLLHDKYGVADIGYLSDIKAACKYLQTEAKRYQTIINDWYSRNNLFTGGAK